MSRHCECGRFLNRDGACLPCANGSSLSAPNLRRLPSDPRYSISEDGVVYGITGKPLTVQDHHGYRTVNLTNKYKARRLFIHRMVLEAFVGPCPPGMEVLHINGVRDDNRLANLRYGTRSENMIDALRHGTHPMASRQKCKQGHEFTEENTLIPPARENRAPHRICRTCRRKWQARYRASVKARQKKGEAA